MDEEILDREAPIVCEKCNTVLGAEHRFCYNCGCKVVTSKAAEPEKNDTEQVKRKRLNIIKSSLVLVMAIFMLISSFVPLVKVKKDNTIVEFNAVDGIFVCVNSLISLDDETLNEDLQELYGRYSDYFTDWENGKELDKLSEYTKKIIFLQLRSENISLSASIIIIAVASLTQITISVLFAVYASLAFASVFKDGGRSKGSLSFLFMGLSAVAVAFNAYALKFVSSLGVFKISAFALLVVILTFIVMFAFFLIRVIFEKDKVRVSCMVKHGLSLTFAVLMLLSCGAPIVETEVKTPFANRETEDRVKSGMGATLFSAFSLNDDECDKLAEMSNDELSEIVSVYFGVLNGYTRREFKNGDALDVNSSIFELLLFCGGAYDYNEIFSFGAIAMMIIDLSALLIIWKELYELAVGKRSANGMTLAAKIISIVMAFLVIILAVVMSFIVSANADMLDVVYRAWISYAPMLALVSAIAGICVPSAEAHKE